MKNSALSVPMAWWRSLMYSSGILLLICGVATVTIGAFFFPVPRAEAIVIGPVLVASVALAGVALLFIARRIATCPPPENPA
jgi:hypothetical protein